MSELKKYLATPAGARSYREIQELGLMPELVTDTGQDVVIMAATIEEAREICEEFHEGVGVIGTVPTITGMWSSPPMELAIHFNLGLS